MGCFSWIIHAGFLLFVLFFFSEMISHYFAVFVRFPNFVIECPLFALLGSWLTAATCSAAPLLLGLSLAWEHRGHDRGVSWAARSNTLFSLIVRTCRRTRFEITGAQRCMIGQCHTVHKSFLWLPSVQYGQKQKE